jgi:GT2 family glycosyltransferase
MDTSDFSDTLYLIEGEIGVPDGPPEVSAPADGFDEAAYLRAFPDVARAIKSGERRSALDHYLECGQREGRLADLRYLNAVARQGLDSTASGGGDTDQFPTGGIDAMFMTPSGHCLVIGWLNEEPGCSVTIFATVGGSIVAGTRDVARCRRQDAEAVVFPPPGKLLGFWALMQVEAPVAPGSVMSIVLVADSERRTMPVQLHRVSDDRLREVALEYLHSAQYYSNPQVESQLQLEGGLGKRLIDINVAISQKVIGRAHCMKFGPRRAKFKASIVVCLYGKAEFLYLQAAFFSEAPGWEAYEFIYVSNSPELAEILVKEATLAARIYGMSITLVILPGNAGFGAANNVAVSFAQSSRIMIVNPDVFPRDRNWARDHLALVQDKPADEVAMFGVPLYYDDGSIMHSGMYFDSDIGLAVRHNGIEKRSMLRVEHYGKGAPAGTTAFLEPRRLPATSGAFISIDRSWFESLGGFSLDYVFGHYEDADLCLKSFKAGKPVWLQNIPFWHLEGKGSTRRPVHEGGSTVNRWHFTDQWGGFIADGFLGRQPRRLNTP